MDSKNHSKNIFDDYDIKVMCDNCLKINCVCEDIEREAGFVKSYEGKTAGKYSFLYFKSELFVFTFLS